MFAVLYAIIDTFMGTMADGKKVLDVKNERWQGFVIESRDIIKNIGKDSCELPNKVQLK